MWVYHFIVFFSCENGSVGFSLYSTQHCALSRFEIGHFAMVYKKREGRKRHYFKEPLRLHRIIVEIMIISMLTGFRARS